VHVDVTPRSGAPGPKLVEAGDSARSEGEDLVPDDDQLGRRERLVDAAARFSNLACPKGCSGSGGASALRTDT
jgi:hypothetical protein